MARKVAAAVWVEASSLKPWARNPRKNEQAVPDVAASILEFGWGAPVLSRKSNHEVIAGHTRLKALRFLEANKRVEDDDGSKVWVPRGQDDPPFVLPGAPGPGMVPCRELDLTEDQAHRLALADNRTGELADWDDDELGKLLAEWQVAEIPLDDMGWTGDQLQALIDGSSEVRGHRRSKPKDEAPKVQKKVQSKPGQVYELGPHRLMCGDSTDPKHVAKLLDGATPLVLHADPPYGMGKENDGVANDNLYRDKLDAFQMEWWRTWRPHLAENASLYVWGNAPDLWRWWYRHLEPFEDGLEEGIALRNEIVWDKGSGFGMRTAAGRCYPPATERCLFAMRGAQEFGNVNKDDYWEGWEPIRAYLAGEAEKMGWGPKDIKRICGVGMFGHWFGKSQWVMIPEKHYRSLQEAAEGQAFLRPYDGPDGPASDYTDARLSGEHLELRREFNEGRAWFDNTHDAMRDVWTFPRVQGEDRQGHATPKPVAMMERIARSSAPEGGLIVEPFGGSGSTLMGAASADRVCYTMELLPEWVDVIRRRWTAWALENDIDPGPGALTP